MTKSRVPASRSQKASGVLAVLLGALAILAFGHGSLWKLFVSLSASSAIAYAIRSGWLIPCVVIGVTLGYLSDPIVKGGTIESQMQETATYILGGAIAGLVVGLFVDGQSKGNSSEADL